jgi:hypothetical protein
MGARDLGGPVHAATIPHGGRTAVDLPPGPKSWHRGSVNFWLALRRLLPLLAVLSLALTPVAAPAAVAGMRASVMAQAGVGHEAMPAVDPADMAAIDMAEMPCCPPKKTAKPDCAKAGCPLLALCLAGIASLPPAAMSVPAPVATRTSRSWPDAASFASVHGPPLPEPPRA